MATSSKIVAALTGVIVAALRRPRRHAILRSMTRWRLIGPVLALGACVSVPPFGDGVGFRPDGSGGTIVGKNFALHFAGGGFAFPDRLEVGGTNVLATRTTCNDEDGVGVAISPGFVASPSSTSTGSGGLTTPLNGPAAVQVAVSWSGSFHCQFDDTASGTSTFTAFPDGRIVRHDEMSIAVPAGSDMSTCEASCSSQPAAAQFFVTSFFTFSDAVFTTLRSNLDTVMLPAQPGDGVAAGNAICLEGSGHQVALAYDDARTRLRKPADGSFALTFDLLDPGGSLITSTPSITRTMGLRLDDGSTDCLELLRQLTDAHVNFDDTMVASDANGIYVAPNSAIGGTQTINAEDNSLPGIAVTVTFPGANDISISVPHTFHQHNADGTFTIWFQDPISAPVTVTAT
jgi:hypothetical protein